MIPRGTTPAIKFTFRTVDTSDIAVAYLTIDQNDTRLIEKTLEEAMVGEGYIEWTLTQEETLLFDEKKKLEIQCRHRTTSGNAGTSKIYEVMPYEILKEGVI